MRKTLALAFLMAIFVTGCTQQQTVTDDDNNNATVSQTDLSEIFDTEMFDLETTFTEPNNWEYSLTVDMPNPCYSFEVEEVVMESYPEQVTLNITIEGPEADETCAQVIETQTETGEFMASGEAIVTLQLEL